MQDMLISAHDRCVVDACWTGAVVLNAGITVAECTCCSHANSALV